VKKKSTGRGPRGGQSPQASASPAAKPDDTEPRTFPSGTYILRMDQPYSRIADALLDYQYWSPRDPQQNVLRRYWLDVWRSRQCASRARDDTKVLDAAMQPISGEVVRREA